jgi:hypothetical protein
MFMSRFFIYDYTGTFCINHMCKFFFLLSVWIIPHFFRRLLPLTSQLRCSQEGGVGGGGWGGGPPPPPRAHVSEASGFRQWRHPQLLAVKAGQRKLRKIDGEPALPLAKRRRR